MIINFVLIFFSRKPEEKSHQFNQFVNRCLVKNPAKRSTATALLQDGFVLGANNQGREKLLEVIQEAAEIKKRKGKILLLRFLSKRTQV